MPPYTFKVTHAADGRLHVWLCCPRCGLWGLLDEDQLRGRVSAECPQTGCGFHETVDFFAHLSEEDRRRIEEKGMAS